MQLLSWSFLLGLEADNTSESYTTVALCHRAPRWETVGPLSRPQDPFSHFKRMSTALSTCKKTITIDRCRHTQVCSPEKTIWMKFLLKRDAECWVWLLLITLLPGSFFAIERIWTISFECNYWTDKVKQSENHLQNQNSQANEQAERRKKWSSWTIVFGCSEYSVHKEQRLNSSELFHSAHFREPLGWMVWGELSLTTFCHCRNNIRMSTLVFLSHFWQSSMKRQTRQGSLWRLCGVFGLPFTHLLLLLDVWLELITVSLPGVFQMGLGTFSNELPARHLQTSLPYSPIDGRPGIELIGERGRSRGTGIHWGCPNSLMTRCLLTFFTAHQSAFSWWDGYRPNLFALCSSSFCMMV